MKIPNRFIDSLLPSHMDAYTFSVALVASRWQEQLGHFPSNKIISSSLGISERNSDDCVKKLRDVGIVKGHPAMSAEDAFRYLVNNKKEQRLNASHPFHHTKECVWCLGDTLVLLELHYPIPKKEGGEDTVSVCPNCHYEYLALTSSALEIDLNVGGPSMFDLMD